MVTLLCPVCASPLAAEDFSAAIDSLRVTLSCGVAVYRAV